MSLTIVIQCPTHPGYMGKVRPSNGCRECQLIFDVRNNTHRVLSVPREERTDTNERIIKEIS